MTGGQGAIVLKNLKDREKFMLITSNNTMKFKAASKAERD
jgi:hypothetical protein